MLERKRQNHPRWDMAPVGRDLPEISLTNLEKVLKEIARLERLVEAYREEVIYRKTHEVTK